MHVFSSSLVTGQREAKNILVSGRYKPTHNCKRIRYNNALERIAVLK